MTLYSAVAGKLVAATKFGSDSNRVRVELVVSSNRIMSVCGLVT
jgi:hypothetical protein